MSIDKINKIASSVSQYLNDNEKISVAIMAARVRKAAKEFPEDQTILSMASVLTRMDANKTGFISRAHFRKMYQGFYTRNNSFAEVFASELGTPTALKSPTYASHEGEGDGTLKNDYEVVADPVLANALQSVFDGTAERNYSEKAAMAANRKVAQMFSLCGLECRVVTATGSPDCIIVDASFETPKGQTNVMVPVEIQASAVLEPSVFVSNRGSEELSKENITEYVKAQAGKRLTVRADQLLKIVDQIKNGSAREVSSVALAVTRFRAEGQAKQEFFVNTVTSQDQGPVAEDLVLPMVQDTEIQSFAQAFDTPAGRASFQYGERKMTEARRVIEAQLRGCGLKQAQLAVQDTTEDTVVFAVNVGKTAFSIPVKMKTATLTANVFVCNGRVHALDSANVQKLATSQERDFGAVAVSSPLHSSKPSDLIQVVRTAMQERNMAKAEDALNVLAQSGDTKAYAFAMESYMGGLSKTAADLSAPVCKCSRVIKTASSKHPVCGHTGLPTHKVYQDANGDCHPMYRKAMAESYEGAAFMTNKIFF